jgi:hypothetical protein
VYPPLMPSEVQSQAIWFWISLCTLAVTFAITVWQWSRPPKGWVTVFWSCGLVLAIAGVLANVQLLKQAVDTRSLWILAGVVFSVIAGALRNAYRQSQNDIGMLVLFGCVVCYLAMPNFGHCGDAVWRIVCKNNLKTIGLRIDEASERGIFSPVTGSVPVSWRVSLLTDLTDSKLAAGYDPAQPWNQGPANRDVGQREPVPYRCPSHRELTRDANWAFTDYALLTGPQTVFATETTTFDRSRISDGTSNTILAVECSGMSIPWTEPRDVDVSQVTYNLNRLSPDGGSRSLISSFHSLNTGQVLLADGSVRSISPEISPEVLKKLTTAAGHDYISNEF